MAQAIASERLAQGPNVAAKVGFEPVTLWTKGAESTMSHQAPQFGWLAAVLTTLCGNKDH